MLKLCDLLLKIMIGALVLEYRIPLQADGALDSLEDHLKTDGEPRSYEVS